MTKLNNKNFRSKKVSTICAKEWRDPSITPTHVLPIYASSSFEHASAEEAISIFTGKEKGFVYSRYGNPTVSSVTEKIIALETIHSDIVAGGMMVSSGMSAISSLMLSLCKPKQTIITQGNLYGGTTELFEKIFVPLGINIIYQDLKDLNLLEKNLKKNKLGSVVYAETPANPTNDCIDLRSIAELAKNYDTKTVVDNTFATPIFQQPLLLGIDFVIHSATKYLNGHGNSISGIIIGKDVDFLNKEVFTKVKLLGTNPSPFEVWLTYNGMKTLALRMKQHESNAFAIANYLENHKKVSKVNYCGLPSHPDHEIAKKQMSGYGGMLSFDLGSEKKALHFMNHFSMGTQAPTLGDVDTLLLHPITSSHLRVDSELRKKNGITPGLVRISIGIEDQDDLLESLEETLKK
jgi:methionine-gamma-lyase